MKARHLFYIPTFMTIMAMLVVLEVSDLSPWRALVFGLLLAPYTVFIDKAMTERKEP